MHDVSKNLWLGRFSSIQDILYEVLGSKTNTLYIFFFQKRPICWVQGNKLNWFFKREIKRTFHWTGVEMAGEGTGWESCVTTVLHEHEGTPCCSLTVSALEHFRPLPYQKLTLWRYLDLGKNPIISLFLSHLGCRERGKGETDHGRLPESAVRPMVRACGRDEQNLIYAISSSSSAPSTKFLNRPTMKWNRSLLRRKQTFRTKTKTEVEWNENMNMVSSSHSWAWNHQNNWRGQR